MEVRAKLNYFVIPAITLLISALSKFFTSYGMQWYRTITLPMFTPPGWFISIVWQIIYVLTTAAVMLVWNRFERNMRFWLLVALFTANAFLNLYWSYLFFYQHRIGAAAIEALFLELTLLLLMFLLWPVSRMTSLLLLPYTVWILFATILNGMVWYMNISP